MWISRKKYKYLKKLEECKEPLELLRCPFCKGEPKLFTAMGTQIECTRCGAKVYDSSKEGAIAKWNRRA